VRPLYLPRERGYVEMNDLKREGFVCAHWARPPSVMIQIWFKYEVYWMKGAE